MALSQRLEFRQSQALVMTPQLMQAIKLLQLSNLDLAAYVEGELERNPLLERVSEGPADGTAAGETAASGPAGRPRGRRRGKRGKGRRQRPRRNRGFLRHPDRKRLPGRRRAGAAAAI